MFVMSAVCKEYVGGDPTNRTSTINTKSPVRLAASFSHLEGAQPAIASKWTIWREITVSKLITSPVKWLSSSDANIKPRDTINYR
ncbi:hypothetical protein TWF569_007652 [Orbilia oligospora]|nr:hypothetical protein TWF569_007652 [Orbilia oligospora]